MDLPDPAPPREDRASVTAPRVEAVVVVQDTTDRLDEVLTSLVAQDYPRFGVVALVSADDEEVEAAVARSAPRAEIRKVGDAGGFGTAADHVLDNTSPPAFYLLCHQDAALASDVLRLLVEEAIRSNASIAGPKLVDWDNPERLVDVGLDVDKLGHDVSRVEPGELDQEQHDAVVDVFAVPQGVQLVRGDLFHALEGFDPTMDIVGGDVDFCWRSHVAGARVMVVPSAVARVPEHGRTESSSGEFERTRERNRVRMILTVYGIGHSIRVIPQGLLYTLFRSLGALLVGQFGLSRAAAGAWVWNAMRPGALYQRRRKVRETRKIPDSEIRPLQVRG
ncbi:MAG: glycosyltransferase family 2 protein, partial [Acidimicrobiales bacterium]